MNIRNRNSLRRRGQALARTVLGLGTVVAGALGYLLSDGGRIEAIILPTIVLCLLGFSVAVYGRARARREWSAAWDAYAERDGRKSVNPSRHEETWTWAGTN